MHSGESFYVRVARSLTATSLPRRGLRPRTPCSLSRSARLSTTALRHASLRSRGSLRFARSLVSAGFAPGPPSHSLERFASPEMHSGESFYVRVARSLTATSLPRGGFAPGHPARSLAQRASPQQLSGTLRYVREGLPRRSASARRRAHFASLVRSCPRGLCPRPPAHSLALRASSGRSPRRVSLRSCGSLRFARSLVSAGALPPPLGAARLRA
jgi:hypothetical protein